MAATEGDTNTARALYLRSLLAARDMGDTLAEAGRLWNLGNLEREAGDPAAARVDLEEALELYVRLDDKEGCSIALHSLALSAADAADSGAAAAYLARRLPLLRQAGDRRSLADWLEVDARVALQQGDAARAAARLGEAEALREVTGYHIWQPGRRAEYDRILAATQASLTEAQYAAAWRAGRAAATAGGWPVMPAND